MDCLFCSARHPGDCFDQQNCASQRTSKYASRVRVRLIRSLARLSLLRKTYESFRKGGPGGKPFCKRVFPLVIRFLKVISHPINGANAIIHYKKVSSRIFPSLLSLALLRHRSRAATAWPRAIPPSLGGTDSWSRTLSRSFSSRVKILSVRSLF